MDRPANCELRVSIFHSINLDNDSVNETHLQGEHVIELEAFLWFDLIGKHIRKH